MNKIMVDNWFMEDVIADIRDNKTNYSNTYADLLMAIVLWDEVYYPENDYNWWTSVPSEVQGLLSPISDHDEKCLDASIVNLLLGDNSMDLLDLEWLRWKNIQIEPLGVVGRGALRYMILSNDNKCDYLPCYKRRNFLNNYFTNENVKRFLIRLKAQEDIDKIIKDYYMETYSKLLDFSLFDFQMPTLAEYVINNTPDEMNHVEFALHLKHEGAVVAYREYLSQVEDAIEQQNWRELRYLMKCSSDVVSDVITLDRKYIFSSKCSCLPNPTLILDSANINVGLWPKPSVSVSLDLKKFSSIKKVRLTFLKDIVRYGIDDRKFW